MASFSLEPSGIRATKKVQVRAYHCRIAARLVPLLRMGPYPLSFDSILKLSEQLNRLPAVAGAAHDLNSSNFLGECGLNEASV